MKPSIFLGLPMYGAVHGDAAISLMALAARSAAMNLLRGVEGNFFGALGEARNQLVKSALRSGASHILFLDADMVVPSDTPRLLLKHDLPVVSGLYFERVAPFKPIVGKLEDPRCGNFLDYPPGVSEVGLVGCGCLLVNLDVFRKIAEHLKAEEWFTFFSKRAGEDISFCKLCRDLGIRMYLDADVKCEHVASLLVGEADFKRAFDR